MTSPMVVLCLDVVAQTPAAVRVWNGKGLIFADAKWIPRSLIQCMDETEQFGRFNITMAEWIAKKKGLLP